MAANTELQPKVVSPHHDKNLIDEEARSTCPPRGGWITFPFISDMVISRNMVNRLLDRRTRHDKWTVVVIYTFQINGAESLFGLTLAVSGMISNLIVYLIEEFNIKRIDAAQIFNIVNGCVDLLPIAGAIIADSFVGNFTVITMTSFISLLGMILLMLTATVHSLRPAHCGSGTGFCAPPSTLQYGALYTAIAVSTLGFGGQRFTIATMGADQFEKPKEHGIFFNWYFIILYVASAIGFTGIVYIQDNIGWNWGYGICVAANAIGLVVFLSGNRYYRHIKPNGSPFTRLARVIVATVRKRNVSVSSDAKAYYYGSSTTRSTCTSSPTSSFRFLNRAAIKTEGDTNELDGSLSKPWRLCTVQQVEDLKTLIRIFPLWSSSIFLSVPIGIQSSLTVLQALSMDRHIGPKFKIPAGSVLVFTLITTAICLVLIDRFLFTAYQKLTRRSLTLQRIGIGHIFNILGMATSALVESKRLHVARSHNLVDMPNSIVPLSALWVAGPLAIVGVGEAFHFPGQVALYYEEFPKSLKSTATAMVAMLVAVGFYLSTALIDLTRKATGWLPDNINKGRIDNVFWFLVVIGVINFGYYLICATLYKHQNVEKSIQNVDNNYDQE